MDSIGAFSFVQITGDTSPQQPGMQDISRPGVEGVAYRILPAKGEETVLTAIAYITDPTAAIGAVDNYANTCVSTLQDITIGGIGTYSNFLILHVTGPIPKLGFTSLGFQYQVISYWRIRATQ